MAENIDCDPGCCRMSEVVPEEGGYCVETEHVSYHRHCAKDRVGQWRETSRGINSSKTIMHCHVILHQPVNAVRLPFQTGYTLHITNLLRLLFWCVCVLLVVLVRFSLRELFVYISCLIAWSRLSVFVAGLVSVHKCVCAPHPCVIPCFRLCVF